MVVQMIGTVIVLIAYILSQVKLMKIDSISFLSLNTLGSLCLGSDAFIHEQWGFFIMEVVWGSVSLYNLIRELIKKK